MTKLKGMLDESRNEAERLRDVEADLQAQIDSLSSQLESLQQVNEQQKVCEDAGYVKSVILTVVLEFLVVYREFHKSLR